MKKFQNKSNINIFIAILVIFLFSLISLTWFQGNNIISVGDNNRITDLNKFLVTLNSSWRSDLNTGQVETELMYHTPYSLIYYPLTYLGLSSVAVEKAYFVIAMFLPAFFMYLFLEKFLKNNVSFLIKLVCSIFYVFNPYNMLQPAPVNLTKYSVILTLPLFIYLITSIFDTPFWKRKVQFGALLVIFSTFASSVAINIAESAPLLFLLPLFLIFEFSKSSQKLKHLILFLGTSIFVFLINFWWIYSSFLSTYLQREALLGTLSDFNTGGAYVYDALRLMGFWAIRAGTGKFKYVSYGESFYSQSMMILTYILPVLIFLPISYLVFFRKKMSKDTVTKTLFSLGIAFFGLFLAKGHHPPFGSWFTALYKNIPFFRIFREPYSKFTLISVFGYVLVISFSLQFVVDFLVDKAKDFKNKNIKRFIPFVIPISFLLLVRIIVFPMFTGEIIATDTYKSIKGMLATMPNYWMEASDYSEQNDLNGRILILPKSSYFKKSFIWPNGYDGRPADLLIKGTTIWLYDSPYKPGDILISHMYESIEKFITTGDLTELEKVKNLMKLLDIRYVFKMNDFDWLSFSDSEIWSPKNQENFINALENDIAATETFGLLSKDYLMSIPYISGDEGVYRLDGDPTAQDYLDELAGLAGLELYKLNSSSSFGKFYVADSAVKIAGADELLELIKNPTLLDIKVALVQQDINENFSNLGNYDVLTTKLSESKYKIKLNPNKNSKSVDTNPKTSSIMTFFVFNEAYDKDWLLARNCTWFKCTDFIDASHFVTNYYANGWLLDVDTLGSDFFVVHSSDFRLKTGLVVSGATFVLLVLGLFGFILSGKTPCFSSEMRAKLSCEKEETSDFSPKSFIFNKKRSHGKT